MQSAADFDSQLQVTCYMLPDGYVRDTVSHHVESFRDSSGTTPKPVIPLLTASAAVLAQAALG